MIYESRPSAAEELVKTDETIIGRTLVFDWTLRAYQMDGGGPVEATGHQAVKAWLEAFLRTPRGKYEVYDGLAYGCSVEDLIGKKLPQGYALSELKREISEGAALCPAIREVKGFDQTGTEIRFTVVLYNGESEAISIGT